MGSAMQPRWEQIPPFGWNPTSLTTLTRLTGPNTANIADGSLITSSFMRPAGVDSISVYLNVLVSDWAGGAGSVNVIVEGSNDNVQTVTAATKDINDHWTQITVLDGDEWFQDVGAGLISNTVAGGPTEAAIRLMETHIYPYNIASQPIEGRFDGDPDIDVGRFRYLRLRAVREIGANTFQMSITVRGTAQDSQRMDRTEALSGSATAGATTWGTTWKRAAGTRYMAVQVRATHIFMDGGGGGPFDGYKATLHASMDGSAPWLSIGEYNFHTDGTPPASRYSGFLMQTSRVVIDMEPFQYFRAAVYDASGGAGNQAFNITFYTTIDTNDITDAKIGISDLNDQLCATFYRVNFEEFIDAGGGGGGTITGQLFDLSGSPLRQSHSVRLVVSDDAHAGVLSPSVTTQITAVNTGTLFFPAAIAPGLTQIIITTNDAGKFRITLGLVGGAATAYVNAEPYVASQKNMGLFVIFPGSYPGSVLYATEYATCVMT
jgi:hypothetical protein